jgi:RNA polymerase sigma-70 factor (ECF subfamily)
MHTTSPTLLERVRRPDDQEAWRRFVALYTPLLFTWASRLGLQSSDASDLVQDVFTLLVNKLPEFRYDQSQSFRAWLRTVLRNKWCQQKRRRLPFPVANQDGPLEELASPEDEEDGLNATEYRQQLVQQALRMVQADFQPTTWKAWSEYVIAGRPAIQVADELGLTVHAVYLAKTRVLRRLREELGGFLDE